MLAPVLIYTDQKSIDQLNEHLNLATAYLQNVYTQLIALGVTAPMADIKQQLYNARNNGAAFIQYCKDSYIQQDQFAAVRALNLSQANLDKMVAYPDFSSLQYWIVKNPIPAFPSGQAYQIQTQYLQVVAGVVSILDTAAAAVTALFTYYTANDRGAEVAGKLIDYLTTYNTNAETISAYIGGSKFTVATWFPFAQRFAGAAPNNLEDFYYFIREQEAAYPDYVAA